MSIRPVDLQVMLHRASEVNRVTNNDGSRAENQNSQFAQSFQKVVEQEGKQVVNAGQAEHADVDKDGRGKGNGSNSRPKSKERRPGQKDDKKTQQRQGMLDIRG